MPDETFEVASVKPNRSGVLAFDFDNPPGRIVGVNVVLRDLIRYAYDIYGGDWDIRISAPEWIKTARYDIDAKTPGRVSTPRAMAMLRNLLTERFGLRVHKERRDMPVYALVIAKRERPLGPQLRRSTVDCGQVGAANQAARAAGTALPFGPPLPGQRPVCGQVNEPGHSLAGALTMGQLALKLAKDVGRPVIDSTDLHGGWDWELRWTPALEPSPNGAPTSGLSIFTALEEQLGLKLEPARGPVEVLVVDTVHEPTPN